MMNNSISIMQSQLSSEPHTNSDITPMTTLNMIEAALQRIQRYQEGGFWNWLTGATNHGTLDQSMKNDFDSEKVAELSAYVGEIVTAIQTGAEVSEEDLANLQTILTFLTGLDETETGAHIKEGIAQGMTEAGWDADAETVAAALDQALATAFDSHSPAQRMVPLGENVAAGIGEGARQHDFTAEASTIAAELENSLQSNLSADRFSRIGLSSIKGLVSGINSGKADLVSAMRSAARLAVIAAKEELKIKSPSRVFRDEIGSMTMKGFGEGVLAESREQARIIRNASRYLTSEARNGALMPVNTDNRKTYNQQSTVNLQVGSLNVRDQQDIRELAIEIAALTQRQQRGKGLRFA